MGVKGCSDWAESGNRRQLPSWPLGLRRPAKGQDEGGSRRHGGACQGAFTDVSALSVRRTDSPAGTSR